MIKGREIRTLPVIDLARGKVLGTVQDYLLAANQKIQGLYFQSGEELRFLPLERMVNLGRDAVLVQGQKQEFELVTAPDLPQQPAGTWVMTAEGKSLGAIDDIVVEENEGSLIGYEISDGYLMDLLVGRKIVGAANIVTFGKDAVIVDED